MKKYLISIVICFCYLCNYSYAYTISPIVMTMSPSGSQSKKTVDIINDSSEPLAIELSIAERKISETGAESIVESDEVEKSFGIYPAQLVVRPNSTRTVQVQYLGKANITEEHAYRLIAEEVAIDFEKPKSKGTTGGVDFLVKYHGSLYVAPKGASPNIVVTKLDKRARDGKDWLYIEVENQGTAHMVINVPQFKSGNTVIMDESMLANLGSSNILAKTKRFYEVPWPEKLSLQQIKNATFIY